VTRLSHFHPLQLVNRLLFTLARARRERVRTDWKQRSAGANGGAWKSASLLVPAAQSLVAHDARIDFKRIDLFDPPAGQYEFVRMMNVLNLEKGDFGFSRDQVEQGLRSVLGMVRDGGLLLVGRTTRPTRNEPVTRATLVEKDGNALRAIWRIAGGSELEPFLELETDRG